MAIAYKSLLDKSAVTPISMEEFLRECLSMSGEYLYRGQGSYRWKLIPSVFRSETGDLLSLAERAKRVSYFKESKFEADFQRLTSAGLERENYTLSDKKGYAQLTKMMLFQHFGVPTPLLDWTESPLVALFMATAFRSSASKRVRIFRLDPLGVPDNVFVQMYSDIGFERIRRQLGGVSFVGSIEDNGKSLKLLDRTHEDYLKSDPAYQDTISYFDVKVNKADAERVYSALRNNGFTVDNLFPNSPHWAANAISAALPWNL